MIVFTSQRHIMPVPSSPNQHPRRCGCGHRPASTDRDLPEALSAAGKGVSDLEDRPAGEIHGLNFRRCAAAEATTGRWPLVRDSRRVPVVDTTFWQVRRPQPVSCMNAGLAADVGSEAAAASEGRILARLTRIEMNRSGPELPIYAYGNVVSVPVCLSGVSSSGKMAESASPQPVRIFPFGGHHHDANQRDRRVRSHHGNRSLRQGINSLPLRASACATLVES